MFFKKLIVSFLAKKTKKAVDNWSKKSVENQDKIFKKFITTLAKTKYGKDIGAHNKMGLVDFQKITHQLIRRFVAVHKANLKW